MLFILHLSLLLVYLSEQSNAELTKGEIKLMLRELKEKLEVEEADRRSITKNEPQAKKRYDFRGNDGSDRQQQLVQSLKNLLSNTHNEDNQQKLREIVDLAKRCETDDLRADLHVLTRQVQLQQLFLEERIRNDGSSGLKQCRLTERGTKLYHHNHITGKRVASIHDHANHVRTVGMGEVVAVLNGVEFRTRHNDYRLSKPANSKTYRAIEDIAYPDVPPEVLSQPTIEDQILEMREWFKAWKEQDYSVRDYRPYFKPIVCYLEGAWTRANGVIEEPFNSDRHKIDAESWFELQEKIRFTSYSGRKSNGENFAFLPTTIMNITNAVPEISQWNYRILCAPLSFDIPLSNFRVIDDIASRAYAEKTWPTHSTSRGARFQLDPEANGWAGGESQSAVGLLDAIMAEVPGMDNYGANLTDSLGDYTSESLDGSHLNAAHYHRVFKMSKKDAMGEKVSFRAYSDANIFFAMNTQDSIAGIEYCDGSKCTPVLQKWSYAIPLEIIYLTPLYNWNPYNIEYKGEYNSETGKTVIADSRNGEISSSKAYDGSNSKVFYRTPATFYGTVHTAGDNADTVKGAAGVLDQTGTVRIMKASGTYIHLPYIPGVGSLRMRYPIPSYTHDGSTVAKELEAVKDMISERNRYLHLYRAPPVASTNIDPADPTAVKFVLGVADKVGILPHTHYFALPNSTVLELTESLKTIVVFTNVVENHNHQLEIYYKPGWGNPFRIASCDGVGSGCNQGHNASYVVPESGKGW